MRDLPTDNSVESIWIDLIAKLTAEGHGDAVNGHGYKYGCLRCDLLSAMEMAQQREIKE